MTKLKFLGAAVILSAISAAPLAAEARTHIRIYRTSAPLSYNHNYGPGPFPGTYAYYDGPSTTHCAQGAASYRGQDRRRHPCN